MELKIKNLTKINTKYVKKHKILLVLSILYLILMSYLGYEYIIGHRIDDKNEYEVTTLQELETTQNIKFDKPMQPIPRPLETITTREVK